MEIYSDSNESLNIQLAYNDDNVDTHNEFLLSAISLVNTIILCSSLKKKSYKNNFRFNFNWSTW